MDTALQYWCIRANTHHEHPTNKRETITVQIQLISNKNCRNNIANNYYVNHSTVDNVVPFNCVVMSLLMEIPQMVNNKCILMQWNEWTLLGYLTPIHPSTWTTGDED